MRIFERNEIVKKILIIFITIAMISNFIMPNYVQALQSPGEKLVSGLFYLIAKLGDVGISLMQKFMTGDAEIVSEDNFEIKYSPGMIFSNKVPMLSINFIDENNDTVTIFDDTESGTNIDSAHFGKWGTGGAAGQADSNLYDTNISTMEVEKFRDTVEYLLTEYEYYDAIDKNCSDDTNPNRTYTWTSNGEKYNGEKFELTIETIGMPPNQFYHIQLLKVTNAEDGDNLIYTEYESFEDMVEAAEQKIEKFLTEKSYYKVDTNKLKEGTKLSELIDKRDNTEYIWRTGEGIKYSLKVYVNAEGGFGKEDIAIDIELKQLTGNGVTIKTPANALQNNIATWYVALRTIALVGLLSVLVYLGIRIILSSSSSQDKAKYKNMLKDWVVAICILFILHYAMALMLQSTEKINSILSVGMDSSDPLMSSIREKVGDSYDDANIGLTAGYTVMYLALVILTGVFTFQYLKRIIYVAFLTMIAPMIALTYPLDKVKDGKAQAFSFWLREYIFNCLIQPVHLLLYTILITSAGNLAQDNMLYAIVALGFLVPAEKFIKKMFGLDSQSPVGTLSAAAGGAMVMSMLNKIKGKPPKGEKGETGRGENSSKGVRTANSGNNEGGTSSRGNNSEKSNSIGNHSTGGNGPLGGTNNSNVNSSVGAKGSEAIKQRMAGVGRGLKNAGKNIGIKGVDSIKSASGRLVKAAPGAILGGTIGLAATVASGGENATAFIGGGIAAGSALSSNTLGGAKKFANDTYADYQKGKYGTEAYNNRKFDKEFYKSEGYKQIAEDAEILSAYGGTEGIKNATKNFLNNGVTDAAEIRKAMKAGITGDDYKAFSDVGVTNAKEMAKAKSDWGSPETYAMAKKAATIAKDKTKGEFIRMAQDMNISSSQAKKIYENMLNLL